MKPLRMNQWVLTWLSLYPPGKTTSVWKRLAYVIIDLIVLGTNECGLGASGTYFLRYLPIDLAQSLFAFFLHCLLCISNLCRNQHVLPTTKNAWNFREFIKNFQYK